MMFDFVRKNNGDELCDTCKNQIGMQSFCIPCPTSVKTEILFDMIDISFYSGSDFVSIIPFFRTTKNTRVGTKIFLGVNMNHSATGRCCTGRFTHAFTMGFTGGFVIDIFDFWTYKFISD